MPQFTSVQHALILLFGQNKKNNPYFGKMLQTSRPDQLQPSAHLDPSRVGMPALPSLSARALPMLPDPRMATVSYKKTGDTTPSLPGNFMTQLKLSKSIFFFSFFFICVFMESNKFIGFYSKMSLQIE